MSKHTSGPWRMVEHSWSDTSIYGGDVSKNESFLVASLSIEHIATEKTQDALESTQSANAKLIAAAPELLEALRPFANFACDVPCDCHNCRARAAVAKAS